MYIYMYNIYIAAVFQLCGVPCPWQPNIPIIVPGYFDSDASTSHHHIIVCLISTHHPVAYEWTVSEGVGTREEGCQSTDLSCTWRESLII